MNKSNTVMLHVVTQSLFYKNTFVKNNSRVKIAKILRKSKINFVCLTKHIPQKYPSS